MGRFQLQGTLVGIEGILVAALGLADHPQTVMVGGGLGLGVRYLLKECLGLIGVAGQAGLFDVAERL